jgi:NAD(P)-dependent dehydrogenase (short-subunit alcohol dehydrogenase family)
VTSRRLEGLRIVVTGASRGLGRAIAEGFAAEGARLVVTATTEGHLASICDVLKRASAGAPIALALDLSEPETCARAADEAVAALGRIDALVNNAAVLGPHLPLAEYPIDELDRVMRTNLLGTLAFTQELLPAMVDGGSIINVTSNAAGRAGWGGYSLSKLAINGLTEMFREELADRSIRCVSVNPGPTRTRMRAQAHPHEDPSTVPHPRALVEPFIAIAAGADPGPLVQAAQWTN